MRSAAGRTIRAIIACVLKQAACITLSPASWAVNWGLDAPVRSASMTSRPRGIDASRSALPLLVALLSLRSDRALIVRRAQRGAHLAELAKSTAHVRGAVCVHCAWSAERRAHHGRRHAGVGGLRC